MYPPLIIFSNSGDHNACLTHGLISCAIISVAFLITGILSYTRPEWSLKHLHNLSSTTATLATQTDLALTDLGVHMEIILRYLRARPKSLIIPSPEKTLLPGLTLKEQSCLAYHPDSLPGGRWLNTPSGRIRVYEFGPESGERVLFIHGISTPSIVARDLLLALAGKGFRVMIFDLPGRGYSECCSRTPQDMRLYSALILMVATSSTAPGSFFPFNLIGYSLGGGIAASFASQFPHLVLSLAVFSSGGLIPLSYAPLGMQCSLIPWIPVWLAERILSSKLTGEEENTDPDLPYGQLQEALRTKGVEPLDIFAVMKWQNKHQQGFMPGYLNSIRHAPVFDNDAEWKELGRLFREGGFASRQNGSKATKLLAIYGELDELTPPILLDKIADVVGKDQVSSGIIKGGKHEIVVYQWDTIVQELLDHWAS